MAKTYSNRTRNPRFTQRHKRIAVIGIKTESYQPAFYVPGYMQSAGFEIVPVPVFTRTRLRFWRKSLPKITDHSWRIDLVNIFRVPAMWRNTPTTLAKNRKPSGCSRDLQREVAEPLLKKVSRSCRISADGRASHYWDMILAAIE